MIHVPMCCDVEALIIHGLGQKSNGAGFEVLTQCNNYTAWIDDTCPVGSALLKLRHHSEREIGRDLRSFGLCVEQPRNELTTPGLKPDKFVEVSEPELSRGL